MVSLAVTLWISSVALLCAGGVRVEANMGDVQRAISQRPTLDGDLYMSFSHSRRLAVEFFAHYANLTFADLYPGDQDARIPSAQDLQCLADFALLTNDLSSLKFWALKSKSDVFAPRISN